MATNNQSKNKTLRIKPELLEVLKLKGTRSFRAADLCKAYNKIPACKQLTSQQIRQFIIRNLKRLERSGLVMVMPRSKGNVTGYKLTTDFHDGKYIIGTPHCPSDAVKSTVSDSLLEKLVKQLSEHEINLVVTLSEIEEYKNLGLQNPSVKIPIQSLYHEAKRRCSKLLGKVKATESLITELRSN